jgi:hypothetical protein
MAGGDRSTPETGRRGGVAMASAVGHSLRPLCEIGKAFCVVLESPASHGRTAVTNLRYPKGATAWSHVGATTTMFRLLLSGGHE